MKFSLEYDNKYKEDNEIVKFHNFQRNISWTVEMNMQMSCWCHRLTFPTYKNKHYFALIQCGYKASFAFSWLKYGSFLFLENKNNWKLWGNDIIDSFICKFISTVQGILHENCNNKNIQHLLLSYFHPILIKLSLFVWKCYFALWFFNLSLDRYLV